MGYMNILCVHVYTIICAHCMNKGVYTHIQIYVYIDIHTHLFHVRLHTLMSEEPQAGKEETNQSNMH